MNSRGAHHAKAWSDFVSKLGLNLVEIHRQLSIAANFSPSQSRDDLLVSRAKTEVALMTIRKAQQFRAVGLPTTGIAARVRPVARRGEALPGRPLYSSPREQPAALY